MYVCVFLIPFWVLQGSLHRLMFISAPVVQEVENILFLEQVTCAYCQE